MKTLKDKLFSKEITIGSWISIGHESVAEIMAQAGPDWLTVDMEHSVIGLHDAQRLIQVIESSGVTPLVRVGENSHNLIKRVMDAGAHGVIVPMVNTRQDALNAVSAVKYPPTGARGVGLARAQGYGARFDQYKKWVHNESVVIVQIEHIQAVENIEQILSVSGVDGFMVGPYDLSGSLGVPGDFTHPTFIAALKEIMNVSRKLNVASGYHVVPPDPGLVQQKVREGYTFLAYSTDFLLLGEMCRQGLRDIRNLMQNKDAGI